VEFLLIGVQGGYSGGISDMNQRTNSSMSILVDWSVERRLQRKQHNLKAPQERGFRDEEIEDVSAESVRSERRSTVL